MIVFGVVTFAIGMIFWSITMCRWKQGAPYDAFTLFTCLMMVIGGLVLVSVGAYFTGLGCPGKQGVLEDGNYYELVCQGTKDDKHVVVLKHLGNDGIKAYYLNEPLLEGKKYFRVVNKNHDNKATLVPTE